MAKLLYQLTDSEYKALSDENKKLYDFAMAHIDDEWAMGPYGGWARAYEALEKIGYKKVERHDGVRTFVSLEKPV